MTGPATTGPAPSGTNRPTASAMNRSAPPAMAGPALPPHPHVFRTEESQP
ncbi:hypothetical protein [Streptomyces sp. SM11]|nr:hypothetical protein [Streptomyces sp. SM11]